MSEGVCFPSSKLSFHIWAQGETEGLISICDKLKPILVLGTSLGIPRSKKKRVVRSERETRKWAACRVPPTFNIKQVVQDSMGSIKVQVRNRGQRFTAVL